MSFILIYNLLSNPNNIGLLPDNYLLLQDDTPLLYQNDEEIQLS